MFSASSAPQKERDSSILASYPRAKNYGGLRQLCCYDNETGESLRNNMAAEKRTISAIGLLKDVEFHMVKAAAEVSLVTWAANTEKLV